MNTVNTTNGEHEDGTELTKDAIDVHRVLLECAPKNGRGRPSKNSGAPIFRRGGRQFNSAWVLKARLAQEKPSYYDALDRGEYKSVTAAAAAAGLIKNDGRMRRAKSGCRKLTEPEERQEFLEWLKREWGLWGSG